MSDKFTLNYPFDSSVLIRKQKSIREQLLNSEALINKRIAILGGSTTNLIKDMLEIFLLQKGIRPTFYESEYNQFFEDAVFENSKLQEFYPDYIYIHTTYKNITKFPDLSHSEDEKNKLLEKLVQQFVHIWDILGSKFNCPVIQNNFELPPYRVLGNLEQLDQRGQISYINLLNQRFNEETRARKNLIIQDINFLSSQIGLLQWHDQTSWCSYRYALGIDFIPALSYHLSNLINASLGKSKKCLVLDLDNTLWGGEIGDDGIGGIILGHETALGEAYCQFQSYLKALKSRGVMLAICSKNEQANAISGFQHPDSILKSEDFSVIKANWEPKPENILAIASELHISIDSIVFIDDNPAERELVRSRLPTVKVPEIGSEVENFITILDSAGFFEPLSLTSEDLARSNYYQDNSKRLEAEVNFLDYGDYLKSLEMNAQIAPFNSLSLDRLVQLINKTNQFNLTTLRTTSAEIEIISKSSSKIALYGRLKDKFGDNGIVTVIIADINHKQAKITHWLMSCRVLKRDMELAMMDELVSECYKNGLTEIIGSYTPTTKNKVVEMHYQNLGFEKVSDFGETTNWKYTLPLSYLNKNKYIKIEKGIM